MQNTKNTGAAFTLVEILIAMTILSIIMVSVMTIFVRTSEISTKTDLQRALQENIKTVVERISEDMRVNGISGVSSNTTDACGFGVGGYKSGNKLCTGGVSENYFVAHEVSGTMIRVDDMLSDCGNLISKCSIYKEGIGKITNSSVSVTDLTFYASNDGIPKVTMLLTLRPAIGNGVRPELIQESEITVQTTFTNRPLQITN